MNKVRRVIGNRRPNSNKDNHISENNIYTENRKRPQKNYNYHKKFPAEELQRRRRIAEQIKKDRQKRSQEFYRTQPLELSDKYKTAPLTVPISTTAEIKQPRRRHFWKHLLIILLVVIVTMMLGVYAYAKFAPLNPDLLDKAPTFNISNEAAAVAGSHRIANVAIFGIDGREDVEGERSDTIMIGSADFEHNRLKVTSLMRDTYVKIADTGNFDKLNAAYTYGGPLGALRTINLNFDTAITDYIVFDFTALVTMVDQVGGIDIVVENNEELYWINQYLMDVNDKVKRADPDVPDIGPQHLTGAQALAYARIRYTGNGDYDRTQRQRNVLEQVVAKVSAMSPLQQISLVRSVLPYVETSLSVSEFITYGLNFLLMSDRAIMQDRIPEDAFAKDGYLDGVSYIFPYTLVDNIQAWYRFVYEIDYQPSPTAQQISQEISDTWW